MCRHSRCQAGSDDRSAVGRSFRSRGVSEMGGRRAVSTAVMQFRVQSFRCESPPACWTPTYGSESFPFLRAYWYESVAFWNLPPSLQFKQGRNVSSLAPSTMNLAHKVLFRSLIDGDVASPVEFHGKGFCRSASVANSSSTAEGRAYLFLVVTGGCSKLYLLRGTPRCTLSSQSMESLSERMSRRQSRFGCSASVERFLPCAVGIDLSNDFGAPISRDSARNVPLISQLFQYLGISDNMPRRLLLSVRIVSTKPLRWATLPTFQLSGASLC
jgi:hypothetical protein